MSIPAVISVTGMLDLDARVHLDEGEDGILDQELEGADALVADLPARLGAASPDLGHQPFRQTRSGRLFQHLLMSALERAVAAAEPYGVAVPVGQHLDLDMARMIEELLGIDLGIAEGAARLLAGQCEGVGKTALLADDPHAASAAAARRLQDDRIADLRRDAPDGVRIVRERSVGTRHAGHARLPHGALGRDLVAHGPDAGGVRTDEGQARLRDAFGEVGVLR